MSTSLEDWAKVCEHQANNLLHETRRILNDVAIYAPTTDTVLGHIIRLRELHGTLSQAITEAAIIARGLETEPPKTLE